MAPWHRRVRVALKAAGEALEESLGAPEYQEGSIRSILPSGLLSALCYRLRHHGSIDLHNALKSFGTSPNFLITLASLKSPVAGSPARLNATAPIWPSLRDSASARITAAFGLRSVFRKTVERDEAPALGLHPGAPVWRRRIADVRHRRAAELGRRRHTRTHHCQLALVVKCDFRQLNRH
jgi:hypothetical protein